MALITLFFSFTTVNRPNLCLDLPKKRTIMGPTMWGNEKAKLDFEAKGRGRMVTKLDFNSL